MRSLLKYSLLVCGSLLILTLQPIPFFFLPLLWSTYFLSIFITSKNEHLKFIACNLGLLVLGFGLYEVYLYTTSTKQQDNLRLELHSEKDYYQKHPILGYAPQKGIEVSAKRYYKDTLIYDVSYTIGPNGLRVSPTQSEMANAPCAIFFGGSFTFGEGVEDEETIPYVVGSRTGLSTYNFGFHGYGPHHMLATVESDRIRCDVRIAVYQFFFDHIKRAIGRAPWDEGGPKYIKAEGRLTAREPNANTSQKRSSSWGRDALGAFLLKSYFFKKYFVNLYRPSEEDKQLALEIIVESKNKLLSKFPQASFQVLVWRSPTDTTGFEAILSGLKKEGITYHEVADIIPDHQNKFENYILHEFDTHPNAKAYRLVADYVSGELITAKEKTDILP